MCLANKARCALTKHAHSRTHTHTHWHKLLRKQSLQRSEAHSPHEHMHSCWFFVFVFRFRAAFVYSYSSVCVCVFLCANRSHCFLLSFINFIASSFAFASSLFLAVCCLLNPRLHTYIFCWTAICSHDLFHFRRAWMIVCASRLCGVFKLAPGRQHDLIGLQPLLACSIVLFLNILLPLVFVSYVAAFVGK